MIKKSILRLFCYTKFKILIDYFVITLNIFINISNAIYIIYIMSR